MQVYKQYYITIMYGYSQRVQEIDKINNISKMSKMNKVQDYLKQLDLTFI